MIGAPTVYGFRVSYCLGFRGLGFWVQAFSVSGS